MSCEPKVDSAKVRLVRIDDIGSCVAHLRVHVEIQPNKILGARQRLVIQSHILTTALLQLPVVNKVSNSRSDVVYAFEQKRLHGYG